MADPKKMSVEEILAACRKMDGGGGDAPDASADEPKPVEEKSPAASAQPAAPKSGKKPGEMSVEEMSIINLYALP